MSSPGITKARPRRIRAMEGRLTARLRRLRRVDRAEHDAIVAMLRRVVRTAAGIA